MPGSSSFAVSVVIPLYNKAGFVREAIESALRQTHAPDEIVLIDDGSTDDSLERVQDLLVGRVRLVRQANGGPGHARNRGTAEARYRWIAFLDADDVWLDDHLSALAEVSAAFPEASLLGSAYAQGKSHRVKDLNVDPRQIDLFELPPPGPFYTSSVAVRRSVLGKSGGFGDYWPGEDAELWVRLGLDHACAITRRTTVLYRQETGGLMDQSQGRFGNAVELHPIFETLARALADRRYAPRRRAIARYRDRWLAIFARQALVAGRPAVASAYLKQMEPGSREAGRMVAMLATLPGPVLRAAMRARSALRRA